MRYFNLPRIIKLLSLIAAIGCSAPIERKLSLILDSNEHKISRIREKTFEPCAYNCVDLHFKLINTTESNLVLYNFNRNFAYGDFSANFFCDSVFLSAEKMIYVFDTNGNIVRPNGIIPDSIHGASGDELMKQVNTSKTWFLNSKQVIRKGDTISFIETVNLKDFQLIDPGDYILKILYYQHNVRRIVSQQELDQDLNNYDSNLFKGCLWSNSVLVKVE